jgi:uncharacterized protein YggE
MKYLLVIIISLFTSSITAEQYTAKGIEVIGKASVKAEPDQFVFTVSINQRGAIANKAKARVDQKSRLVTNMYRSMGIAKNAIESARLQLTPRYEKLANIPEFEVHQGLKSQGKNKGISYSKVVINSDQLADKCIAQDENIYFEVSRTIKVTFKDFTLYDQLLDNVVKIGVSRISPLQTSITNTEALYQKALIKALKNANNKAEAIAKQINVKLGGITSFKESSYHTPKIYMMASRSSDGFSSQAGQNDVSAQVSVTFAIKEDK